MSAQDRKCAGDPSMRSILVHDRQGLRASAEWTTRAVAAVSSARAGDRLNCQRYRCAMWIAERSLDATRTLEVR